jgi:glutathione-regulated potassium-efflux system ancillary protein KefC/glutathione-regulated potassium-efflux system protein KefB
VVFVPLFQAFRVSPVLAYLFAGIVIGPDVMGLIQNPKTVLTFSELGVVFLLFIIGLELEPARLWKMRRSIFGLGALQVLLTGALFFFIARALGLEPGLAYVAGFGLALSSTAFAIQLLEEKHQLKTTHGQGSFSILMFQDIAVVPLMASLVLFSPGQHITLSYYSVFKALGLMVLFALVGRYLIRHVLRTIANTRTHEVFLATSLLIVMGSAHLMEMVGLSMGMGAFLAGVLLANSEYRHELQSHLEPFKGLLLGLFFMAVGMSLDLKVLGEEPHWVLLLTLSFMLLKGLIIFTLGRLFRYPYESARNMAATLPQGGEFAFVLFSTALAAGLLNDESNSLLSASVTLSMGLTPMVFSLNQKWLRSFSEISERPYDKITYGDAKVIIAGYGRFGQIVSRFLKAENISHTILEHSAAQVDVARRYGNKVYYGDASRADILESAGIKSADIFVLAIDDPSKSTQAARLVREHYPEVKVIARARNRQHVMDLLELGVQIIHRETLMTSLEVAKEVLMLRGLRKEDINRRLARFRAKDEAILRKQFDLRNDEKQMMSFTIRANEELEQILREEREGQDTLLGTSTSAEKEATPGPTEPKP